MVESGLQRQSGFTGNLRFPISVLFQTEELFGEF